MHKKGTGLLLIILFLAMLLGSGCQKAAQKPLENQPQKKADLTASDRRILADRLSRLATAVEGVQKATVVISDITLANDSGSTTSSTSKSTKSTATDPAQTSSTSKTTKSTATDRAPTSISGMVVMVGIGISDQVDEEKTKVNVKDKLKASDGRISQVLVTSDPELVKKINDMAAGIIKGEPISKYEMDLKQLKKDFQDNNPAY